MNDSNNPSPQQPKKLKEEGNAENSHPQQPAPPHTPPVILDGPVAKKLEIVPVSPITEPETVSCDAPAEILEILGPETVLIPVKTGEKAPALNNWQKIKVEDTRDPEYRRQLCRGNIGVLLGAASSNLCAIDIDNDEDLVAFLNLNPKLQNTLRTRGARGAQLWVRLKGEYPKLTKIQTTDGKDFGEFRSDGAQSVIHGIHPTGVEYTVDEWQKPVEVAFDELVWLEGLKLPWVKTEYDLLVEDQGDPFAITERGDVKSINHAFFVEKFRREHIILFDSTIQEFYEYQANGTWKRASQDTVKRRFMDDFKRVAKENHLPSLLGKRNHALATGFSNYLRGEVEREDAFRRKRDFIHVTNGVLRIEQGKISLVDFNPEFYSRNIAPFEYDPAAQCPRFLSELLEPALCAADISLVQRWAGSVLLGRNIAQRFLLVTGTAGGGKSTLMNVIEAVIGAQNVAQLRTDHLGERFELFQFDGKTLLTGKDVAANFLMRKSAHVIKALVGHDLLEAEKKNSNERVQLRGDFNLAITCNSQLKLRLEGDTGAWGRRLLIINYDKPKPAKPIADFASTLIRDEGAGILNWMVQGALLHSAETAEHGDYLLTADQKKRNERLLSESDSIRKFVEDWVVPAQGESITSQALLQGYIEYCEHMQWEGFTPEEAKRALPTAMRDVHKVSQSHDLQFLGKPARGYRHFGLAH